MGKRAMVTGASGGIGRAFAERLAAEGWEVTAVARNAAGLERLVASLPGAGHRALPADLSESAGVAQAMEELGRAKYALLINNAGAGTYGPFREAPLESLQAMVRLNCDAVIALAHAFLSRAVAGDALLNVSSTVVQVGFPASALYTATKALVLSLSENLWEAERHRGVYVCALCPGVTTTNFHVASGGDPAEPPPKAISQTPGQVVDEAMAALRKRKAPVAISGGKNRLMVRLTGMLPRPAVLGMMGKQVPKVARGGEPVRPGAAVRG